MKLRIENSEAKDVLFGNSFCTPAYDGEWVSLNLTVDKQKLSNWCWAAIGVSLSRYYNRKEVSQEYVAAAIFNVADDEENILNNKEFNTDQRLDKVLELLSCFSHWSLGKPSFDRIKVEINNGRPVCVRIQWYKGGSHYVVIKGYRDKGTSLQIEDSLTGYNECFYDEFPKKYKNTGAVWIETFWTEKLTFNQ